MTKAEVKKTLEVLLKLQDIDSKLAELSVSKVFYPQLLEKLRGEVLQFESDLKATTERITDLKKNLGLNKADLDEAEARLQKSQERLLMVRSNKEYDAVQREIRANDEKIASLKEESVRMLEDLLADEGDEETLVGQLKKARENNEREIDEIEKKFASIEEKVAGIRRERDKLASRIDRKILNKYELICDGTQGHAVVRVINRACGGCFQALPPRQCQQIRSMSTISFCETCGRILVWDEEQSP